MRTITDVCDCGADLTKLESVWWFVQGKAFGHVSGKGGVVVTRADEDTEEHLRICSTCGLGYFAVEVKP